jgi:hypothetical protein
MGLSFKENSKDVHPTTSQRSFWAFLTGKKTSSFFFPLTRKKTSLVFIRSVKLAIH